MINRRKAKELPFSTLRFLRISVEKTRRRKRVHDLLLMLVRVAVLVLIALGLAKPTITNLSVNFFADEKEQVDFATVFDEDSVADDTGRLTSADGNVLGFDAITNTMILETADLQAAEPCSALRISILA
jgi:hypothetical protein